MKNAVFWDVAPCGNSLLVTVYVSYRLTICLARTISSALKMEVTCSSETFVYDKLT
jgi:hypothetical protein